LLSVDDELHNFQKSSQRQPINEGIYSSTRVWIDGRTEIFQIGSDEGGT